MAQKIQKKINDVVAVLEGQRLRIQQLHADYHSAYDAVFDEHGALASAQRWCDRTTKLILDNLSPAEAKKFQQAISSAPRGSGSWRWRELCEYLDTYLMRLIDDVKDNPDDPSFGGPAHDDKQRAETTASVGSTSPRYDVFLSYSTSDKDEARAIYDALEKTGKKCFLAEKSLQPGDKFKDEIRDALTDSGEVWILISPSSVKSEWVHREVSAAWALKKRIVPILFRCAPSDLPDIISDAHAIDFHKICQHIERRR